MNIKAIQKEILIQGKRYISMGINAFLAIIVMYEFLDKRFLSPIFYKIVLVIFFVFLLVKLREVGLKATREYSKWILRKKAIKSSRNFENIFISETKDNKPVFAPYYSLEKIDFRDYKGIMDINLDINPGAPWVFLMGENGYGKTVMLQAIATALYGRDKNTYEYFEDYPGVSLKADLVCKKWRRKTFNAKTSKDKFDFIACYGVNRLSVYSTSNREKEKTPLSGLFKNDTLLENIEDQLINWWGEKQTDSIMYKRYEAVKKALTELMDVEYIEIEPDEYKHRNRVYYYEKDKYGKALSPVESSSLAAGYRAILGMVGDIFISFYNNINYDEINKLIEPRDFKGLVLIDELELHFHPKWQLEMPVMLSKVFPQIQFIASTHSPIPLLGSPPNSVFLKVDRTLEEGIVVQNLKHIENEIKNMLPNTILTSDVFDMDNIISVTNEDLDDIITEDSFRRAQINTELKRQLKILKNNDQDFYDSLTRQ